jgi:DNA-directed RNA polymerase subunit RPC12/RpoP
MTAMALAGHVGTGVTIDVCEACHVFWFDQFESLQLTPAATLKLFELIGRRKTPAAPLPAFLRCPRCSSRLVPTHDRQRETPFEYQRCDHRHGRLITFFNFLREKDFVRPLSPEQLQELRDNVQSINCSNCGAPIDLVHESACSHCGTPLSMLDMKQAERLIAQLRDAATPKPIDPDLPLKLAQARMEVESLFPPGQRTRAWWTDASSQGLVEAGIGAVLGWWKKQ